MKKSIWAAMALVAAMASVNPAEAATILTSYTFSGTFDVPQEERPSIRVENTGTMTVAFDTVTRTRAITEFGMNIAGTEFDTGNILYQMLDPATFGIGGTRDGLLMPSGDSEDFLLEFTVDRDARISGLKAFSASFNGSTGMGVVASRIGFEILSATDDGDEGTLPSGPPSGGPVPGAVPEPSTWALMLAGFGAVGVAMRRARRNLRLRPA